MPSASPDREPGAPSLSIDLVRRIQAGDTAAWDELYMRYRDRLLLSIRCRLGPTLRARLQSEDVLHSVFGDVLHHDLRGFAPQPGGLDRYLHTCVLNKIRNKADFFGAQKRRGDAPLTDSLAGRLPAAVGGELGYVDAARYERLERAIGQLPVEMREALLLRRIEGLGNQEVAAELGKSPEAASKLYNRALARLGTLLGEAAPPGEPR
ncbi:MAG: RNA polymerase sigma factor [Planctomycetota bacterium]